MPSAKYVMKGGCKLIVTNSIAVLAAFFMSSSLLLNGAYNLAVNSDIFRWFNFLLSTCE